MDDNELDDILENALQDFEQEEAREKEIQKQQNVFSGPSTARSPTDIFPRPPVTPNTSSGVLTSSITEDNPLVEEIDADEMLAKALASLQMKGRVPTDAELKEDANLDDVYTQMSAEEQKVFQGFADNMQEWLKELEKKDAERESGSGQGSSEQKSFQDTIRDTVNMLKQNTDGLNNVNASSNDSLNFGDFAKLLSDNGPSEDGDDEEGMYNILEKIMETLMSPDILKQPMEELRREYPIWLEENKGKVDPAEYERVQKQNEYAEKICRVYETSTFPACLPQLIDLMKDMQTYGSPPDEIVKKMTKGEKSAGIQDMCPMQ